MFFTDTHHDELGADPEGEDTEAGSGLDDSLLDEIEDDTLSDTDEGFGHLPEPEDENEDEEQKEEEDEEDDLLEEEEDAEDVDYDTFDDIDEM